MRCTLVQKFLHIKRKSIACPRFYSPVIAPKLKNGSSSKTLVAKIPLILLFILCVGGLGIAAASHFQPVSYTRVPEAVVESPSHLTMLFVGDVMLDRGVRN